MTQFITPCFFSFFLSISFCSTAQKTTPEQLFKRFDSNQSGWLSGKEIDACNCKSYDTNNDNEITKEEFMAGKGGSATPGPQPARDMSQTKGATASVTSSNLKGAWWFTTILYKDGTTYELKNRQSGLDIKENGTYILNTWLGGANNMRTDGVYKVTGNKLTLLQKDNAPKVYTATLSNEGSRLTIIANDGSGYKAERGK